MNPVIVYGIESMLFYCMFAWLPDILIQRGMDSSKAGWMLSLMQLTLTAISAAFGPMPLIILIEAAGICLVSGLGASRDLYVGSIVDNKGTAY
ncbi:hypothetical protein FHR92_003590 [Fontibacillus solani]|uniref:Uncharacterized protein n=1 Tax=Fontibacillus solani TaxID=1572857 RepID=A0A7W3XT05_9BACL|nr:hypothetical protein [Fontibacillus solani]MBA9087109.1 hypothetical protein [Fontibacillus solani]